MKPEYSGQFVIDFSPATRNTHPETSKVAEKKITESGGRKTHCQIIYECLKNHNGSTTQELSVYLSGVLRFDQIWRRMADLEHNDYIRSDGVRGGFAIWWVI